MGWHKAIGQITQITRHQAEVEVSFLSFGNSWMNRVPQMPPSAHRSNSLLSGFPGGMQLVLAPLSCLLGEEPDEEQHPASLEQQCPNQQVGQPQTCLLVG